MINIELFADDMTPCIPSFCRSCSFGGLDQSRINRIKGFLTAQATLAPVLAGGRRAGVHSTKRVMLLIIIWAQPSRQKIVGKVSPKFLILCGTLFALEKDVNRSFWHNYFPAMKKYLLVILFLIIGIANGYTAFQAHALNLGKIDFVGHIGGETKAVFVQGDYAYIGEGPRLVILDITNPVTPTLVGKTSPLPGLVYNRHYIDLVGEYFCTYHLEQNFQN
ncbi:MAG: hypothetical protein AB1801_02660 [Chloroflexota bacterium]